MNDERQAQTEDETREQREGWALDERNMPRKVVGYICPHDYWWCPAIGVSIPGSTLFATEAEARREAITRLRAEREEIERRITTLIQQSHDMRVAVDA